MQETVDNTMSFLASPRAIGQKRLSVFDLLPAYRSEAAKGILSTLDQIDGPSIHVNTARKMKKDMIDHVRAVSIIKDNTNSFATYPS